MEYFYRNIHPCTIDILFWLQFVCQYIKNRHFFIKLLKCGDKFPLNTLHTATFLFCSKNISSHSRIFSQITIRGCNTYGFTTSYVWLNIIISHLIDSKYLLWRDKDNITCVILILSCIAKFRVVRQVYQSGKFGFFENNFSWRFSPKETIVQEWHSLSDKMRRAF